MAGLLHDIGKVMIPDEILNKPGKLTDSEFDTVRSHPVAGGKILMDSQQVSAMVLDVCLHRHEKVDACGDLMPSPQGRADQSVCQDGRGLRRV